MIQTDNLSVPVTHGKVKAHRLSLRSKRKYAETRKSNEKAVNLSGGERHYGEPVVLMSATEEQLRHETTVALLTANGVDTSFDVKKGVFEMSQDLQNEVSVVPKPKAKARPRSEKEPTVHIRKATPMQERPQCAGAKGARVRKGSDTTEPLEKFVPKLGKDDKRVPLTKKCKADYAKFESQMAEWREMKRLAAEMQ